MSSTFFGLSVAQSGLAAQRRAMDVLGYNIANANDPTYKRQRTVSVEGMVLAQSQESSPGGSSAFGSGVRSGDIERIRDVLIENRLRQATQASSSWDYKAQTMSQLEATLGEPSDNGLQADLDNFWNAWDKVATTPDSLPLRGTLLEDSSALAQRIQYIYSQINDARGDVNAATVDRVDRINVIAGEIGRLNNEIGSMQSGDVSSNDLQNRRDALVLELSKLVAISQHGGGTDNFIVSVGGRVLVQGNLVNKMTCADVNGSQAVQWASDGENVIVHGGELQAIVDLRDVMIPNYLSQLDTLASTLVAKVNEIHRTGKTLAGADGGDFFRAGTTAANISLDDSIIDHPQLIAASEDGAIGNSDIAHKIAALNKTPVAGSLTINDIYRALIGDIGGASATAGRQATAHKLSLQQFTTQQQSISGVSLDEEMTNMIKFQQAYNASARIITVVDEMLSILIERTGSTGR